MAPTLRALLTGLIDYAGLFPPAKLPLDQALRNYAAYRQGPDRWMLGRFIIPAARLVELAAFDNLFLDKPPFRFSVLGRGGKTSEEFLQGLTADLAAIAEFCDRHADQVTVDVLEVKLPDDLTRPDHQTLLASTLDRAAQAIEAAEPQPLWPFYEMTLHSDWRESLQATLAVLGKPTPRRAAGFKLRCGGLEASAFPSPEQIAWAISLCSLHAIRMKATAGLHHPFRHFDAKLQVHIHGFINVFGAAVLARSNDMDHEILRQVIEDEDPLHFLFDDSHFCWGNYRASLGDIRGSRLQLATSFGSCSFDEPREDLRALKLLP